MFSEPAQPYTILDEMFFISSITVYQQAGRPGTKSRFLHRASSGRAKMLVGSFPNPSQNCIHWMQAACSGGTLPFPYEQKSTPKGDAKSTFGVFCLPALLPVRLRCLFCEESLDIFLCPQKPLHLLPGFVVSRVEIGRASCRERV